MANIWTSTQAQQDPSENIITSKQLLAFNDKRKKRCHFVRHVKLAIIFNNGLKQCHEMKVTNFGKLKLGRLFMAKLMNKIFKHATKILRHSKLYNTLSNYRYCDNI
jgi:hypothetical protein